MRGTRLREEFRFRRSDNLMRKEWNIGKERKYKINQELKIFSKMNLDESYLWNGDKINFSIFYY